MLVQRSCNLSTTVLRDEKISLWEYNFSSSSVKELRIKWKEKKREKRSSSGTFDWREIQRADHSVCCVGGKKYKI